MVDNTVKITLLRPGLTWIIHGVDFSAQSAVLKTVYAGNEVDSPEYKLTELVKKPKDCNLTPALPRFKTRAEWIQCQKRAVVSSCGKMTPTHTSVTDGLLSQGI